MRLVFTSYSSSNEYDQPQQWLKRIAGYTGILEALAKEHEVTAIERINYEGELVQNGVHYKFTRLNKRVVRFPRKLHGLIKGIDPDVVFINGFIFPLQLMQLRWKLGKKVKIIVLHRSEKPFKGSKRALQKIAARSVDAFLFSSDEFGKDWKGIINTQKIHEVIQASSVFTPADKNKAKELLGIKHSPVFVWVGGLNPNKDPVTLIKAFKQFSDHQPGAILYVIHQSDELINECKELVGDNEHIKLRGKIDHDKLNNWYNAADLFISTSHYEGNGVAALEAMSCGCIPILTDIHSFRRMTGPGKCGVLFKAGNVDELSDQLKRAAEMNMANEKDKVLRHFNTELSFEAIARKINKIIKND